MNNFIIYITLYLYRIYDYRDFLIFTLIVLYFYHIYKLSSVIYESHESVLRFIRFYGRVIFLITICTYLYVYNIQI